MLLLLLLVVGQVHDFWHTLFGCHTNVFGELALKALEFVQVRTVALNSVTPSRSLAQLFLCVLAEEAAAAGQLP
jgi:ubiquinone biosynthesis protein Coq4